MGAEGLTDDAAINAARARRRKAMIATMLVSQGVPMFLAGDAIGNSQQGNNNVYCQDNETSWIDWANRDDAMLDFCTAMIELRHAHPVLAQDHFLLGESTEDGRIEIAWYQPDGSEMDEGAWNQPQLRVLGVMLDYSAREVFLGGGRPLFIALNAGEALDFVLPERADGKGWVRILDTSADDAFIHEPVTAGTVAIPAQALCLFEPG